MDGPSLLLTQLGDWERLSMEIAVLGLGKSSCSVVGLYSSGRVATATVTADHRKPDRSGPEGDALNRENETAVFLNRRRPFISFYRNELIFAEYVRANTDRAFLTSP